MRSMYRFSVIALAVGAMALFGMAKPGHAEVKVSGVAWAGIGIHKITPQTGNSLTDIRADSLGEINFTGGVGNVTGKIRYRVVGQQNQAGGASKIPAAVRHQVDWKVSDALDLVFMGQSFGLPEALNGYGAYTQGVFTSQGDIGDLFASPEAFFVNTGGLDIRFAAGAADVGIAIIDQCKPDCGSAGAAAGQESTFIPHAMFKAGQAKIALYFASAAGKDAANSSVKSNEFSLNAKFASGSMQVGFEYVGGKNYTAGSGGSTYAKDAKYTGIALGGKAGPIGLHYVTRQSKNAAGTKVDDWNEVSAAYTMPLTEQAQFILGITQRQDKLAQNKDMLLLASAKTSF